MDWQTPADAFWANNFSVSCQAFVSGGRPSQIYKATHLPTQHYEKAHTRGEAINKLQRWLAGQPAPVEPAASVEYRRAALHAKTKSILDGNGFLA